MNLKEETMWPDRRLIELLRGTRAFVEKVESAMLFTLARSMSETPTPRSPTAEFEYKVGEATAPVTDAISNIYDQCPGGAA